MKIGIIGNGFVGNAMTLLEPAVGCLVWDIDPKKRVPDDITFSTFVHMSQIIFVAVPTPMRKDGSCSTHIVEEVVREVKAVDDKKFIVLRSTVTPGTCEALDVSFMPEFLTEKNWEQDFRECTDWYLGTNNDDLYNMVREMFGMAYATNLVKTDQVVKCSPEEAELVKYFRNCFLSVKVSFCNEFETICNAIDVDYNSVVKMAAVDKRIGLAHTAVPGHDGRRGFGGTCFPKDTNALTAFMKSKGVLTPILESVLYRNEQIDRPERDWEKDKGRAVVNEDKEDKTM